MTLEQIQSTTNKGWTNRIPAVKTCHYVQENKSLCNRHTYYGQTFISEVHSVKFKIRKCEKCRKKLKLFL